jgi:hypothetical protein
MRSYIDLLNRDNQARLRARGRPTASVEVQNPVEELERVMAVLEERYKLPKKIVLTRWLSCADAVRVILSCRDVYTEFFLSKTSEAASVIVQLLEDSTVMAWFACMQDVLPVVLTGMNILFQASKPLPHLLYSKITTAKSTLRNMVGRGPIREDMIPLASVNADTPAIRSIC